MDDWWMLMRKRGLTPSEINKMTLPDIKLEVLIALDEAIDRHEAAQANQSQQSGPPSNTITPDMDEEQREAQMAALSRAFKQSKGLNT